MVEELTKLCRWCRSGIALGWSVWVDQVGIDVWAPQDTPSMGGSVPTKTLEFNRMVVDGATPMVSH